MVKLGLVGTINNSGLGVLAKEFHKHIGVDIHYVITSNIKKGTHLDFVLGPKMLESDFAVSADGIEAFIREKPDLVVFFEYPYDWNFVRRLHDVKIPIVWFPMIDSCGTPWMRNQKCLDKIDYFVSPTKVCHETLMAENLPSIPLPWPIDTDYYAFKQRGTGSEVVFLHNAGFGGDGNRKGWDIVYRAWQRVKGLGNCRLIVHSLFEFPPNMRSGFDYRFGELPDPRDLYDEGDVYLSPSRKEGLGLPFREAMSCGLPVIGTDIPPLNEVLDDPEFLVRWCSKRKIGEVQNGDIYEPDLDDLVKKMTFAVTCGTIKEKSLAARKRIEEFSWAEWKGVYKVVFEEIVKCRRES